MQADHALVVKASQIRAALELVAPKSRKRRPPPIPLTFRLEPIAGLLSIADAWTAARRRDIPAAGAWPAKVQVDGAALRRFCDTLPGRSELTLIALAGHLVILTGGARVQFKRIDADGAEGIAEQDFGRSPKHRPVMPDTGQRRVRRSPKNATWLFSARVPFPRERDDDAP